MTAGPVPGSDAVRAAERARAEGDPLAVILYRLQQIERRMDSMMSADLYAARHEALQARVKELEREQDESARSMRQIVVGVVLAVLTTAVTAGLAIT